MELKSSALACPSESCPDTCGWWYASWIRRRSSVKPAMESVTIAIEVVIETPSTGALVFELQFSGDCDRLWRGRAMAGARWALERADPRGSYMPCCLMEEKAWPLFWLDPYIHPIWRWIRECKKPAPIFVLVWLEDVFLKLIFWNQILKSNFKNKKLLFSTFLLCGQMLLILLAPYFVIADLSFYCSMIIWYFLIKFDIDILKIETHGKSLHLMSFVGKAIWTKCEYTLYYLKSKPWTRENNYHGQSPWAQTVEKEIPNKKTL
jgi:hypothetical protein